MVAKSFTDTRGSLVANYDGLVALWTASERAGFANTTVNVTARWMTGRNVTEIMEASAAPEERPLHDVEHGAGLLAYEPLIFSASFDFKSYYPGLADTQDDKEWSPLPGRSEATHVAFEFTARSGNGSISKFVTASVPLVYDLVVRPRTPAPDNKCRREQSGVWRDRQCHVVKQLKSVCVQVQLDDSQAWQPHSKPAPTGTRSRFVADPAESTETYGCDMTNRWSPADYVVDQCWGRRRWNDRCPTKLRDKHSIKVTFRSAQDPFLRAEELTDNTLDFGLSSRSQRLNGIVMLVVGGFLCIIPIVRVLVLFLGDSKGEEARSLRYQQDDHERNSCTAGVYGNRVV
mmetsp:Transcript_29459/g.66774  ORF Transcript_29459/g.66774 Transcript_29459/m.66774 type:complete len:345 (-) Transcript_29459:108-1142(-)